MNIDPVAAPLTAHGYDQIRIRGIRVEAIIGFSEHETTVLQPVDVDLVIEVTPPTSYLDDPSGVVDYKQLKDDIRAATLGTRYQLLEVLAQAITAIVLSHEPVQRVTITAHKPGALTGADDVAVRLTRSRA